MNARVLTQDLGHDIQLQGVADPRSAVIVSVVTGDERRSVLVVGNRVAQIDFETYLDQTPTQQTLRAPKTLHRLSRVGSWFGAGIVILTLVATFSGILNVRVILTGSMAPAVNPGDVVIAIAPELDSPTVGDIVLYTAQTFDGTPVADFAHRVVGGNAQDGFVVKGDSNAQADLDRPTLERIEGVVQFHVPFIGRLLNPQSLALLMLTWLALWLLADGLRKNEDRAS